jgi:hypothetical protein
VAQRYESCASLFTSHYNDIHFSHATDTVKVPILQLVIGYLRCNFIFIYLQTDFKHNPFNSLVPNLTQAIAK